MADRPTPQQKTVQRVRELGEAVRRGDERPPRDRSCLWAVLALVVILALMCGALLVLRGCLTSPIHFPV